MTYCSRGIWNSLLISYACYLYIYKAVCVRVFFYFISFDNDSHQPSPRISAKTRGFEQVLHTLNPSVTIGIFSMYKSPNKRMPISLWILVQFFFFFCFLLFYVFFSLNFLHFLFVKILEIMKCHLQIQIENHSRINF